MLQERCNSTAVFDGNGTKSSAGINVAIHRCPMQGYKDKGI
jgi:hypothetical protein